MTLHRERKILQFVLGPSMVVHCSRLFKGKGTKTETVAYAAVAHSALDLALQV